MAHNTLSYYTRITRGPGELDLALASIGRKQPLEFRLESESPMGGEWFRDCTLVDVRIFRDPRPKCRCGSLADVAITLAILAHPELVEIRIYYDISDRKGDVLGMRLSDGTLIDQRTPLQQLIESCGEIDPGEVVTIQCDTTKMRRLELIAIGDDLNRYLETAGRYCIIGWNSERITANCISPPK